MLLYVAMPQNVDLYCASEGLGAVIRAWFDRDALARAMGLQADHQLLLSMKRRRIGLVAGLPRTLSNRRVSRMSLQPP